MRKNIGVNILLFSDLLVKEPVDKVNEQLTGSSANGKIILTGGRGCGKSVVLGSRVMQGYKTEHPAVLVKFEGAGLFGTKENKYFNKQVIEHYYEVIMCKYFLDYVRNYYPNLFNSKFGRLADVTDERLLRLDKYINYAMHKDVSLEPQLFSGEALSEMLNLFRNGVGAETLTLMIDRFDWTHNSDPRVQEILKNYFSMFEKVIITSDDSAVVSDRNRRQALREQGYQLVDVDYGRDLDVVTEIVEKRFALDGITSLKFPIEMVGDEDYLKIIDKCGGNIDTILDTFNYAGMLYDWDKQKEVSTILEEACQEKVSGIKQLRKMGKPPKLHL